MVFTLLSHNRVTHVHFVGKEYSYKKRIQFMVFRIALAHVILSSYQMGAGIVDVVGSFQKPNRLEVNLTGWVENSSNYNGCQRFSMVVRVVNKMRNNFPTLLNIYWKCALRNIRREVWNKAVLGKFIQDASSPSSSVCLSFPVRPLRGLG